MDNTAKRRTIRDGAGLGLPEAPGGYRAGHIESFSTGTLVRHRRTEAWNEIYSSRLASADIMPSRDDFSADLAIGGIYRIGLVRLVTGACTIRRTTRHIDGGADARICSFLIQLGGEAHFAQRGNDIVLQRGDITLCDNAMPHCNRLGGEAEMLLVRVPRDMICEYLPHPEILGGRKLRARDGIGRLAIGMACSLWRQVERGLDPAHAESIAHQLLDMFAASYSTFYGLALSGPFEDAGLHSRAIAFIEENIGDNRMSAVRTAAAIGVTTGNLLSMFLRRGVSYGSYVARRRLGRAARQLRNPRWRGATISQIAYGVGYSNISLFNRSFQRHFGVSPTRYRRDGIA